MILPPLTAVRAFEAAARHLSFSKAGDELCVTHAAISHQIKQLEQWLGQPLFERLGRGVKLTEAGQQLQDQASSSLNALAHICSQLKNRAGKRSLSIGCIASIASRWLIPHLAVFSKLHPDIRVNVLYAQAGEKLTDGDYDMLITLGEDKAASSVSQLIFPRENFPVCSPHYLAQHPNLHSPTEILQAELLHDDTEDGWRRWAKRAGVNSSLVETGAGPVFQDSNLLVTAAIAGHGVALCPPRIFHQELARGDLVILTPGISLPDGAYFLIGPTQPSPDMAAFSNWFLDLVRNETNLAGLNS